MASSKKKRFVASKNEKEDSSSPPSSDEDMSENEEDIGDGVQESVMVDFEAFSPEERHFPGIKRLLRQLFRRADVDFSEMTNLILQQNYVGSVLQQSNEGNGSEDNDMDEDDDEVYGVMSVLNITDKKDVPCIQQLKEHLEARCVANKNNSSKLKLLNAIISDDSKHIGFLLSERFINLPPAIAVPCYENLTKEIAAAEKNKMKFSFAYFMLLSKIYKLPSSKGPEEITYSNAEEELLEKEADLFVDYSVVDESDEALSDQWKGNVDGSDKLEPFRRLFVFRAEKLDSFINGMKINL